MAMISGDNKGSGEDFLVPLKPLFTYMLNQHLRRKGKALKVCSIL